MKTETNPYGQTSTYECDSWFRKIKATDYLQNTIAYTYTNNIVDNSTVLSAVSSDGTETSEKYDEFGRKINEVVKANVSGYYITKNYTHDIYDRIIAEGVPYKAGSIRRFQKIYDVYGRVIQQISPTGLRANITYSGLTSTADDGSKTKKITKDAIGNVIEVIDSPGGTIKYSYYANGNLKETDVDGIKTKILQDKWGRKTQLEDPSAGTYKYTYNDFNELIKEENNNGITNYKLNSLGRLEEKTILGTNTDSKTIYSYNSLKQISGSEFTDNWNGGIKTTKTYFYDSLHRNDKIAENTPYAAFTKAITYDHFGRIDTETSISTAGGKTSSKTLKRTYQNGSFYQILDGTTVLWQKDNIDFNGELGWGTFGNGIIVTNKHDGDGYNTSKEFTLGTTNLLKLENFFDREKGNLNSRKTNLFDYPEEFKYDSLDRLTEIITLEQFLSNTFNTSNVEGYQGENVSGISSSGGALSVQITNAGGTVKRTLLTGAKLGDGITLAFDLRRILGSDSYNVYIQEQDPVSLATVKYLKGTIASTSIGYTLSHTVTQYTNVILRIEKVNTTSLNVFILDNVVGKRKIPALQGYDTKGRITSNDLGTYNYPTSGKVYQNSSIDISTNALPYYQSKPAQTVTYNAFNSPYQIEDTGVEKVSFNYNDNNDRSTIFYGGVQDKLLRPYRKYYSGDGTMEIKENKITGEVEFITYIGGDGYSAPVVFKSDGGSNQNYLYLHRDYQESIIAISNQAGTIVEKRLFDPWGNIIKVLDGAGNTLTGLTLLDRGYTGHEHLQSVGFIHMNGRLYDPKLRRFIQADNNIQNPFDSQNYNRYGYVLNNPLKYTDPSGEFWNVVVGYLFAAYVSGAYASGGELNPAKWNSSAYLNIAAKGASIGASTVATNFTNNYLDNYNKPPELGISAADVGNKDLHPYVSNESSNSSRYNNQALEYAGSATAVLVADDATVIGVADDVLIPVVAGIGTGIWLLNNREVILEDTREIVDAINRSLDPKGFHYVTYTKTSLDGSKVYVGRSSGVGTPEQIVKQRDAGHHMIGYGDAVLTSSLPATVDGGYTNRLGDPSYWSIRGSEQLQIEYWYARGMSGNSIWGIGINNGNLPKYIEYGLRLLF
ncbi:RHS repeat-associated core domain-containing protein [Flavobacterium limi]|uniref:RHS repeat-associated core domain-containing protein n=1 Tax=Flavobacterium limi TaxID=2045105 RepID=A0ABQ1U3H2_9FLAO|nr:RHS repeat-associated core domain-containing protein [Flavobacterium limi]GGF09328.1 hypothetical protein GCM10011518_18160 [Flavobacterium limi]